MSVDLVAVRDDHVLGNDVLGLPVVTMAQPDAGTLGAAMLAGVGIGWWPDVAVAAEAVVRDDRIYEPDPAYRDVYDERYATDVGAYEALTPVFAAMAR